MSINALNHHGIPHSFAVAAAAVAGVELGAVKVPQSEMAFLYLPSRIDFLGSSAFESCHNRMTSISVLPTKTRVSLELEYN